MRIVKPGREVERIYDLVCQRCMGVYKVDIDADECQKTDGTHATRLSIDCPNCRRTMFFSLEWKESLL